MKGIRIPLILLFCTFVQMSFAQEEIPDEVLVSYSANQKPLKSILLDLSLKTEVNIAFQDEILPVDSLVTIQYRNVPLGIIIDDIIDQTGTKYKIVGDQIVIVRDEFRKSNDQITISGYLTDKLSGENLIAANVFLYDQSMGTISNEYGFYSFTIPKGVQRLYFSYLGYKMEIKELRLAVDTTINVKLDPSVQLNEILILDSKLLKVEESPASMTDLELDLINSMVSLAGESDVLGLVRNQAGVSTASDGFGGMSIRGGSIDQNLILMDGVPIYNPNHALGMFSIFNTNVIKSATLYKSGFPARYGSRLSSVLDIWIRDGNKEKLSGELSTGLLVGKATIEGPIAKGKSSFLVSFRRTYYDKIIQNLSRSFYEFGPDNDGRTGIINYFFYDLNAKVNFKLSDKSSIYFSVYQGKDQFLNNSSIPAIGQNSIFNNINENNWDWGNRMGVVRFSQQLSKKAFLKSSVYLTQYNFETFSLDQVEEIKDSIPVSNQFLAGLYNSDITDIGFNLDFDYLPNNKNTLRFGSNVILHSFKPGVIIANNLDAEYNGITEISRDTLASRTNNKVIKGTEIQFYFENNYRPNQHNTFNLGFHQSLIMNGNRTFFLPQPRLAYLYNKNAFTFKTSLSFVSQYLHLITNSGLGVPVDVWLPSTEVLEPQKGWVASMGFNFAGKKGYTFGSEIYYKTLNNLLSFNEGEILDINQGDEWEQNVPVGDGYSYGIETHLNKVVGNTIWNMNYTWSKSDRQFDEINNGEVFRYRFDRRHNFKVTFLHKINTSAEFTFTWNFATGNPITLPFEIREVIADDGSVFILPIYKLKNQHQLPNYHRLDCGFNFYSKYSWGRTKLHLGIMNLYGQQNPFYVELRRTTDNDYNFQQFAFPKFLPSLNYSVSF